MTTLIENASPRQLARTAGVLSLINILLGFFALGYVPAAMGSVTLHSLQANEQIYRLGLLAHVIVTATNVGLALVYYELFKVVSRRLAMLDVFLILVATAIEAATIVGQFVPLELLDAARSTNAFSPEQLLMLASLPANVAQDGYYVYTIFFGLDYLIPFAILTFNATFLPRVFGLLMAIDGIAYLTNAFASITAPAFSAHLFPYILLPILICEGSLCLWFLIAGVDTARWQLKAARLVAQPA